MVFFCRQKFPPSPPFRILSCFLVPIGFSKADLVNPDFGQLFVLTVIMVFLENLTVCQIKSHYHHQAMVYLEECQCSPCWWETIYYSKYSHSYKTHLHTITFPILLSRVQRVSETRNTIRFIFQPKLEPGILSGKPGLFRVYLRVLQQDYR